MQLHQPPVTPVVAPAEVTFRNGIQIPNGQPVWSLHDHGGQFGHSVFEGMRIVGGKLLLEKEHTDRLYRSADLDHVRIPMIPKDIYRASLVEAIKTSGYSDAYIRVQISRGPGSLGIDPDTCGEPVYVINVSELKLYPDEVYANGINLAVATKKKIGKDSMNLSEIKCGNYLNNILALMSVKSDEVKDAIMITREGWISEATVANIFWIKGNTLYTPSLETNCLEGTTINRVCELAKRLGYQVERGEYFVEHLLEADEAGLTGTGAGILAIATINEQKIGSGKRGPQVQRLTDTYKETMHEVLTEL